MRSTSGIARSGKFSSQINASIEAVETIHGRTSTEMSGGHKTSRRAIPSSSTNARVVESCSLVINKIACPRRRVSGAASAEPQERAPTQTPVDALQSQLSEIVLEALSRSHNDGLSASGTCFVGIFINPNEVTKSDWKIHSIIGVEGIEAQMVLKARDDYGKTQRIEARIEKGQIVGQ